MPAKDHSLPADASKHRHPVVQNQNSGIYGRPYEYRFIGSDQSPLKITSNINAIGFPPSVEKVTFGTLPTFQVLEKVTFGTLPTFQVLEKVTFGTLPTFRVSRFVSFTMKAVSQNSSPNKYRSKVLVPGVRF